MPKVPTQAQEKPSLKEIKADLEQTRADLEAYADSPALTFAKQKLREAVTGIEQHLRNEIIDAQLEAQDAAKKAKQLL